MPVSSALSDPHLEFAYTGMMSDEIRKKWETLLASLTVPRRSEVICPEMELERAESELGFKFPTGYKEFCSVFGSGSLGQGDSRGLFRIYCPCCPPSAFDIRRVFYER